MKQYKFNPGIFKAYDIRGVVGDDLTLEAAYFVGLYLATLIENKGTVLVGFDARSHSHSMTEQTISGLRDGGVDVYNIGICPTPVVYFGIHCLDADAGIMITGSHNPPEFNGFKITLKVGGSLSGKEFYNFIEKTNYFLPKSKGTVQKIDITNRYIEKITSNLKFERKNLKIGLDAMNGSSGDILQRLAKILPFNFILKNADMSGDFREILPEPSLKENVARLQDFLITEKLDYVFGFDGDADRVLLLDHKKVWYGDDITLLLAHSILPHHKGAKVIFDIKSSIILEEEILKLGGVPIIFKTGHSLIKQKMQEEGAVLAGEMSGHIYINDGKFYPFDDGIYCFLRIIEYISEISDLPLFPHTFKTPEIKIKVPNRLKFIENARAILLDNNPSRVLEIDGIKAYFENDSSTLLVRSSNTEDIIIARFESKTLEGFQKMEAIFDVLKLMGR